MTLNTKVRLTKLGLVEIPHTLTADADDWVFGNRNEGSPPLGYAAIGRLLTDVVVGKQLRIDRTDRPDAAADLSTVPGETRTIPVPGIFVSSPVESIDGNIVTTANSRYLIEPI